jgi:lipoprotein-releasing system permease protein
MTLVIPEVNVSIAGVAPRIKRLKVVGIFDVGYAFDSMYLFIHYQDASKLFKTQGGATGVQAQLRDPFQSPSLVRKMHSVLKHQYSVLDWTAMNQAYFSAVKMEKTMMFFILLLILAIAVFNLISTLVMVVTDKRADIAILRTLGASRGTIMQIFMTQGAIIGFIGTLLGVLFGVLLALNVTDLVNIIQQTFNVEFINQDIYLINFLPAKLLWRDVLLVASCGFGLSLLATIHPAWRASNIQPAEALRYEK